MSTTPHDPARLTALFAQFREIEKSIANSPSYALRSQRSEILDELQDVVGLGGKMVTEKDILKRAAELLGNS